MMPLLLIFMQLALAQPQPRGSLSPTDSVRLRVRVDSATEAFLEEWTGAWADTWQDYPGLSSGEYVRGGDERIMAVHCHWDRTRQWLKKRIILGTVTAHATCPRFLPPGGKSIDDERLNIDNGLNARNRVGIAPARHALRLLLRSAAQRLPGDLYLVGQRVRFALDARDFADAARAALSCGFEPVQCGVLQALILFRLGDIARADSAFSAAADLMSSDKRCEWNDVRVLLDQPIQAEYERMSCAARAEFESRLWWLSDPLWMEPGNERRAEHFARKVTVQLLAALGDDGRQQFVPKKGGESVIESLLRYGWPSQMFWGGPDVDSGHSAWLLARGAEAAPPYVVREYTRAGRLHAVPLPSTLAAPFAATRDGWQLGAPDGDDNWWPQEHYARDLSGIVQLPVGQTVMLRRRDSTRLVWAGDLDAVARGNTIDANRRVVLFDSRSVGNVELVGAFPLRGGTRAIVDAPLAPGKTLLGIEVSGDSAHVGARTRYAADIDAPLSALAGRRSLSQALLFDPETDAGPKVETEQAVERMYGSTALTHAARVGVYWESYGFSSADTVDIAVRVTREDTPNVLVRAMRVLGIGGAGGNDVAIRWREVPGNSRAIQRLEGKVPLQLRSIVMDVSRLPRGSYMLQLVMSRPGETAVASERGFVLR
ncbi:MAG: hypothetical protein H0W63_03800 [Gemmatimonadaceae bacterium]|nr:hypothetical protein [Gemmatimonadaceae bacterium]